MNNWDKKTEVQKGKIGEALVLEHLLKRGLIPYRPEIDGPHPFDRLCASADRKHILIAEIKTKAHRTYYPDTGFNIKHYNEYKHISQKYNLPIFIYFVDENKQEIYGNTLAELEKPTTVLYKGKTIKYPKREDQIIYFPLENMKPVCKLNDDSAQKLKELSTRNYNYE